MKKRKLLSFCTAVILAVSSSAVCIVNAEDTSAVKEVTAYASDENDEYFYTIKNGSAIFEAYYGEADSFAVPAEIDGYPVTEIRANAFSGETLKSVTIPDTVTKMGSGIFRYCTSLESVKLPSGITELPRATFFNCTALKECKIPETVTKIGTNCFARSGITKINIPAAVSEIDTRAFYRCINLTDIEVDAQNTAFASQDGILYNKALTELEYYPAGKGGKLTIGKNISEIYGYSLAGCDKITGVSVENGNTIFSVSGGLLLKGDELVFYPYDSSGKYTIPANITTLGSYSMARGNLKTITVPDNIKTIKHSVFCDSPSLTSAVISDSVTEFGESVFLNCESLTDVKLPKSLDTLPMETFENCSSLKSIDLPSGIKAIGEYAFADCEKLARITIPNGVAKIDYSAFEYCTALSSVVLPDSVSTLGEYVFSDCENLKSINIPAAVDTIPTGAFEDCTSLSSVDIAEGVSTVNESAFWNTGLQTVIFPKSITYIASDAFERCRSLKLACFKGDAIDLSYVFDECAEDFQINYLNTASGWETPVYCEYPCYPVNSFDEKPSTETSSEATTETTTETTTKTVTEPTTETTTKDIGNTKLTYGGASANDTLSAADSAAILQKVLNNAFKMPIEDHTDDYKAYIDVNLDGQITSSDAAMVLQKVLNSSFVMPIEEKNK